MTPHQPTAAVREAFGQAQQQADAMAGPPTPWDAPTRARRRSPRRVGFAVAAIVAGGVAGWLGVEWWAGSVRVESAGSSNADARVGAPTAAQESLNAVSDPNGFAKPAATLTPVATTAPSLAVTHQSGVIRITSINASLADAVRALAEATHTHVNGGEVLASIANPVTMHWQGKDTAAAWDALLGRFANFAVSCGSEACALWIVGVNAPQAAGAVSAHGSIAVNEPAPPPPRPVVRQAAVPPPDSDENTETN